MGRHLGSIFTEMGELNLCIGSDCAGRAYLHKAGSSILMTSTSEDFV